jgi:hypothetical protein
MTDIRTIANELNANAFRYQIGNLQDLRKELKGFERRPGSALFSEQTIFEDYAFHHGGRSELQFNIGYDGSDGKSLRYGIAFSFETSQTLPDIDDLRPQVRLFNEYLSLYPNRYSRMRMWHWDKEIRSADYMPSPISAERIANKVFVFLGQICPINEVDTDQILRDFDDLLPLYSYVISNGSKAPLDIITEASFVFRPGCTIKKLKTTAQTKGDPVDVDLRHNTLQLKLYQLLVDEFGEGSVGTELSTENGSRIDVVLKHAEAMWFYEIKTLHSPRACIRDAIGQLLEYSHWPKGIAAAKLIVVGENALDTEGSEYLATLHRLFSLPIEYRQVQL